MPVVAASSVTAETVFTKSVQPWLTHEPPACAGVGRANSACCSSPQAFIALKDYSLGGGTVMRRLLNLCANTIASSGETLFDFRSLLDSYTKTIARSGEPVFDLRQTAGWHLVSCLVFAESSHLTLEYSVSS